jgi:HEAT repeat protein
VKKCWVIGLVMVLALLVTARLVTFWLKPQPSYQGYSLSHWLNGLGSTNYLVREQAFEAVVQLGPEAALALTHTLRTRHSRFRRFFLPLLQSQASLRRDISTEVRLQTRAAKALVEIGPPAVPALFELFKDDQQTSDLAAAGVLRAIGPAILASVVERLKDPDRRIRGGAAQTIAKFGGEAKNAVPALLVVLNNADPGLRSYVLSALAEIGAESKPAVPQLTKLLNDDSYAVRDGAIRALGEIGPEARTAVPALAFLLEDSDETIRCTTALALGKIGTAAMPAAPALRLALHDTARNFAREAASALAKIDPHAEDAIVLLTDFLGAEDLVFRCRAAMALGEIGSAAKRAVPALMRMLTNVPPQDDRFAFEALQKIEPEIAERFVKESIARRKPAEKLAKSED